MKRMLMVAAALLAAGACTAAAAASIEGSRDIQAYRNAAGEQVMQMPASALVDWQALDDQSLTVWTANDKPWLVRLDRACEGLMHSDNVALTSRDGQVKVGTDYVELGATHCKIASIQPIDYARVAAMTLHPGMHRMHRHAMVKQTGT